MTENNSAEDNVRAAALHCVVLDESGEFPADHGLGLFEVAISAASDCNNHDDLSLEVPSLLAGDFQISAAQVDFVVRPRGVDRNPGDTKSEAISVTVLVEVALGVEESSQQGQPKSAIATRVNSDNKVNDSNVNSNVLFPAKGREKRSKMSVGASPESGDAPPEPLSKWEDIEAAATAAAATITDRGEAQVAISALACWNLMLTVPSVAVPAMYVDIVAAFGNHGDWYTANRTIPLTHSTEETSSSLSRLSPSSFSSGGSSDHTDDKIILLSASFDWQPPEHVWEKLDNAVVADMKVYDATYASLGDDSAPSRLPQLSFTEEQLLLQATLCKRELFYTKSQRGSEKEPATQATLTPLTKQSTDSRRSACTSWENNHGGRPKNISIAQSEFHPADAHSRPCVVTEIDDREWWTTFEEKNHGRGMEAVHALPRLLDWKPGQWKKRLQRKRKQEKEKERRRAEEAAHRRKSSRAERENRSNGAGSGSSSGKNKSSSAWGAARRVGRVVKRKWRNIRRSVEREIQKIRQGMTRRKNE